MYLCVSVWVCVCVYVYVCVCIRVCVCMCVCICACVCLYACVNVCVQTIKNHICTYVDMITYFVNSIMWLLIVCTHTFTQAYRHTHAHIHTHIHTHTHTHTHTYSLSHTHTDTNMSASILIDSQKYTPRKRQAFFIIFILSWSQDSYMELILNMIWLNEKDLREVNFKCSFKFFIFTCNVGYLFKEWVCYITASILAAFYLDINCFIRSSKVLTKAFLLTMIYDRN